MTFNLRKILIRIVSNANICLRAYTSRFPIKWSTEYLVIISSTSRLWDIYFMKWNYIITFYHV